MPAPRTRAVSAKGMMEYRPYITRGLLAGSRVACADNTGAKELKVINVIGYSGRLRRVPSACVGEMIAVSVRKGTPDLKGQIFPAVVVSRQRRTALCRRVWSCTPKTSTVPFSKFSTPQTIAGAKNRLAR